MSHSGGPLLELGGFLTACMMHKFGAVSCVRSVVVLA